MTNQWQGDDKRMLTQRNFQSTKAPRHEHVPLNPDPLNIFQPEIFSREIPDSALNDEDLYIYKILRGAIPKNSQQAVTA